MQQESVPLAALLWDGGLVRIGYEGVLLSAVQCRWQVRKESPHAGQYQLKEAQQNGPTDRSWRDDGRKAVILPA